LGTAVDKGASVVDHSAHAIDKIRRGKTMSAVGDIAKAVDAGQAAGSSAKAARKQIQRKK